jgi:hypothetical protein
MICIAELIHPRMLPEDRAKHSLLAMELSRTSWELWRGKSLVAVCMEDIAEKKGTVTEGENDALY